ncbi:hypothetical protein BRADI_3g16065v3 [Brachypodium distachyon]|uniref:Uncharacterized protein n=1 Tax=Brachypodium distachyon TaxID=15368 RepID=A0A0Q3LRW4_BRADI|nr:hypothetical protein BRADI_3g16065v3 [Brachypodium distachyon]
MLSASIHGNARWLPAQSPAAAGIGRPAGVRQIAAMGGLRSDGILVSARIQGWYMVFGASLYETRR